MQPEKTNPLIASIGFHSHAIQCIIGIYPHERKQVQQLLVDLSIKYDISKAVKSEHINDTISYSDLADLCTSLAVEKKYQLVETFAYEVIKTIKQKYANVVHVKIKVKKPAAIKTAKYAFVELESN